MGMRRESGYPPRKDFTGEVIQDELDKLSDQELVSKYKPKFLGYGGEHVVFSLPGHPNVVAKVHKGSLEGSVQRYVEDGQGFDVVPEGFEEAKAVFLQKERAVQKNLQKHFGDAIPRERPVGMRVPVTIPILEASIDRDLARAVPDDVHEVLALVRIQERAPEAALSPEAVQTSFQYLEKNVDLDQDVYASITAMLHDGTELFDEEVLPNVMKGSDAFVRQLSEEPGLAKVIRDFAEHAIGYSEETGELLDLAGPGNVIFYQEDDAWKCLMIDAKYPDRDRFTQAQEQMQRFLDGESLTDEQANWILNALAYVRSINATLALTGSEKRLRLVEADIAPESDRLFELLKKQFID
jgi:hypothetical protein